MENQILIEGWLRKKGEHVNLWRERYFIIRPLPTVSQFILCYYRKKEDKEPRGWYILGPGCTVDQVRESPSKIESKKLFTFRIDHYTPLIETEYIKHISNNCDSNQLYKSNDIEKSYMKKKINIRRKKAAAAAAAAATAVVLTGGLAGVSIGAAAATAAASAGVGALFANRGKQVPLALAAESKEIAEWWRNHILDCINQSEKSPHDIMSIESNIDQIIQSGDFINDEIPINIQHTNSLKSTTSRNAAAKWNFYCTYDCLRIYTETKEDYIENKYKINHSVPTLKASLKMESSPKAIFNLIMDVNGIFYKAHPFISHIEIIKHIDKHSDIIYMKSRQLYLWPFYVSSRDFYLIRYWRKEEDNSYVVCYQSTTTKHQRKENGNENICGDMLGGGFIIAPTIQSTLHENEEDSRCLVTLTCQLNPAGWIHNYIFRIMYFDFAYAARYLEQLVLLKTISDVQNTVE